MKQFFILAAVVLFLSSHLPAEVRYSVLQIPQSDHIGTIGAQAVNNSGQVVGYVQVFSDDYESSDLVPFFWEPGMSDLHKMDFRSQTYIHCDINNHGMAIAGKVGWQPPHRWDIATGQMTELAGPGPGGVQVQGVMINDNGWMAANYTSGSVYWDPSAPAGSFTTILPSDGTGSIRWGRAAGLNNLGELAGLASVDRDNDGVVNGYENAPFKYNIHSDTVWQLPILNGHKTGGATCINDNGVIGGWSSPSEFGFLDSTENEVPCYWDAVGQIHDLCEVLPPEEVGDRLRGRTLAVGEDGTLLISARWWIDHTTWLYQPGVDTEARALADLVKSPEPSWTNFTAQKMSENGILLGNCWGGGSVLYLPYEVMVQQVSVGAQQSVSFQEGLTGGVKIVFEQIDVSGNVVVHYGNGTLNDFAFTFLPDPSALNDIQDYLLAGDAQYWSLDLEGGEYDGPLTLTFGYDATLLPDDFDPTQLVMLHFTGGSWEVLVPTSIDLLGHTITVQTDSLSPFLLGAVIPEPATLVLLGLGGLGLLKRRK